MRTSQNICRTLAAALLLLLAMTAPAIHAQRRNPRARPGAKKPNVVFVLIDDMGYGDLGSYGATDIRTPHIDSLARDGVRLTSAYSNGPNCTPTRAALMTGRYQQRVGLEWALVIEEKEAGLPAEETSVARMLKGNGYRTALFGKWHLGSRPEFSPVNHGFDEFFGFLGGNIDFYAHKARDGEPDLYEGKNPVRQSGYMTDLITKRSVEFIDRRRSDQPFFLYAAYNAVHAPYQKPDDPTDIRDRETWQKGTRADYARMLERVDTGVGAILRALERNELSKDTLVVFASDNGGTPLASNKPLRQGKGTLWEGGIRVACLMRWTGVLPAAVVSDQPVMTMDLTSTILAATGTRPPAGRPLDGIDILPALRGGAARPNPRTMFWRIDHKTPRATLSQRTARRGRWKYMRDGATEMLIDLDADASERNDVSSRHPAVVSELREELKRWEAEMDRQPTRFSVK